MRFARFLVAIVLCVLLRPPAALSEDAYFLNPGFKFGHTFGENAGFTIGIEVSYTKLATREKGGIYGVVASMDYCRNANRFKFHLGGEYLVVDVGPTLILEGESADVGIGVTPYFGLLLIPYYSHTFRFEKNGLNEMGAFLKFPILVKGPPFRIGE